MNQEVKQEVKNLIKIFNLKCTIEEFKDKVDWNLISCYQKLSEDFIREFKDKVDWLNISERQKLSENFVREFKNFVNWKYISFSQKLSEYFIREFQDKVDWYSISHSQKLSEDFIREFKDKVYWINVSECQKLSVNFRKEFNLKIHKDNWIYKPVNFKLKRLKELNTYEIINDKYIIAYKGIRFDNYSKFNFQYKYEIGKTYEAHCDCNIKNQDSFGLSAWTLTGARNYCNQKIIKVKININDLGGIVHNGNKLRCKKFTVLEEVKD